MAQDTANYSPISVTGKLDAPIGKFLPLIKWILVIPHILILIPLLIIALVATILAFLNIIVAGRYPRALFDFNLGVLRYIWRVEFYSYNALGTDKYPPFTLKDIEDYPARLSIEYPEKLERIRAPFKWILAIPHLLIVDVFVSNPGLILILVICGAFANIFVGRYPKDIFTLVVGMNRWALRVSAYIFFMTDQYPPFRLEE